MVRQLAEGLDGYAGPTFPPTLRKQGDSLEVSLQGWLGSGQGEPTSLMRGPPRSGAQGQWATEAAGDKPN